MTVYPLSLEEDVSTKKKTVGTHTSYMSCCTFPNSDQQVCIIGTGAQGCILNSFGIRWRPVAGFWEQGTIRDKTYLDYLSN